MIYHCKSQAKGHNQINIIFLKIFYEMKLVSLFVKKDEQKTIHVAVCQTVGIQEETYKKPKKKKNSNRKKNMQRTS